MTHSRDVDMKLAARRGLMGRCPSCGATPLFRAYLKQVQACPSQAEQLLAWAAAWPQRAWAVQGAAGLGCLLARQLVAAGEPVLDVPPKLAARGAAAAGRGH